ncbi:hypothetical protein H8356DRAFT_1697895 [Neocallimastix lanati (nom. inval.)]|jgi:large subunit ribosomal protein LP1|uniref:Ribosomal protein 60S n=1 Tax=Neocallimastix californiae TaxID=1754190 RepID=A0A1Y2EP34_9FUNG|nr:hypothetical protein H8356DRAFT_1697895 [Neocallimastix sp. JGI-2020a]ORY73292.1 hypothetical protein LY90DRAFT_666677 [Neocallimastix californiae]|eukprot:ORY73292.1 hypothetical protein LY90DRAFT_666677 [Neocallimastix californiae]
MSTQETALVYAALICQDSDVEITAQNLSSLLKAANVEVNEVYSNIFAKALNGADVAGFIEKLAVAAPAAGAAAPAAAGGDAPAEEAKQEEEEEEESDSDMGFGLFD